MFPQAYFTKWYWTGVYWEPAGEYVPPEPGVETRFYYRGRVHHANAVRISRQFYYVDEEV